MRWPRILADRSFRPVLGGAVLSLFVLVALVAGLTWRLRQQLRAEVLRREAEALNAVASLAIAGSEAASRAASFDQSGAIIFAAALESSKLRGVLALQLFDPSGGLRQALPDLGPVPPEACWWRVPPDAPEARFHPQAVLERVFGAEVEAGSRPTVAPLLEAVVPLRANRTGSPVLGIARYWVDGSGVAAEFERMDSRLFWLGVMAFLGSAAAVVGVLFWALRRLAESARHLAAQGADLARANAELNFAAKTGALGAISAHLIHGLKNPLAGLEGFVSDPAANAAGGSSGEAWSAAVETTRRLRELVQEVAGVLREEGEACEDHPVPAHEILKRLTQRSGPSAGAAGIHLDVSAPPDLPIPSRAANLTGLVLANLVANAIEASPRGARVTVSATSAGSAVVFRISDQGGGLRPEVKAALFEPVSSRKPRGTGVGLAISRRLARHAAGDLLLERTGPDGTVFALSVPSWSPPKAA